MMTADLAGSVQHTKVRATADRTRIERVLSECEVHGFDGAMVQPCWVPLAAETVADTDVSVRTALEYPLGGDRTHTKVAGIHDAVAADATIRLMSELGGLTDGEAEREIEYAVGAGFDYRKNSSGFGVGGQATVDRIRCIADRVDGSVGVKASGGITTAAGARALLDAGADLLGASSGVAVVAGGEGENGY